ncbi:MAG TPA: ComF family protein [Patescibacteria group bacterium]
MFQVCPKCERFIIDSGKLCQSCKRTTLKNKDFFLDALAVAAKYRENNLSRVVHFYKYNLVQDLHIPLGRIMAKAFLDNSLPLPDLIVPVPLHPRRLRWRGFNQSELLANYISENLTPGMKIPVLNDLLIRKKHTTPQMKVRKYSERKENIQNAFALNPPLPSGERVGVRGKLKNKKILLIDDIATTGATLNECAKVLKNAGAKKVFGLVLARQEISKKSVTELVQ